MHTHLHFFISHPIALWTEVKGCQIFRTEYFITPIQGEVYKVFIRRTSGGVWEQCLKCLSAFPLSVSWTGLLHWKNSNLVFARQLLFDFFSMTHRTEALLPQNTHSLLHSHSLLHAHALSLSLSHGISLTHGHSLSLTHTNSLSYTLTHINNTDVIGCLSGSDDTTRDSKSCFQRDFNPHQLQLSSKLWLFSMSCLSWYLPSHLIMTNIIYWLTKRYRSSATMHSTSRDQKTSWIRTHDLLLCLSELPRWDLTNSLIRLN